MIVMVKFVYYKCNTLLSCLLASHVPNFVAIVKATADGNVCLDVLLVL